MNVEARNLTIEDLFKKGQFIIPEYQREYDWTVDNLNEFFNDIKENEEENYFIGHIVCEGEFNGKNFNVIDGQQRITTITIMISVLRDIFYMKELNDLADGMNNYIFARDRDNNEFIILDNKMPYPILQLYVQSKPEKKNKNIQPQKSGEKKIIKAYDIFFKEWQNHDEELLKEIRDKILNLEIIFVAVSDEIDAFTIFETLNAKGKDLTPLDLIKNQIFKNYEREAHIDEPNDSWKEIIENSKEKNIKFLNYFWASRYKKVSDRKIYKEFIKESKNTEFNYNNFVSNLLDDSKIYKKIIEPKLEDWQGQGEFRVFISLNAIIKTFNIQVVNSLLMSLVREYNTSNIKLNYLIKSLEAIEKFHFVNNAIIGNRSSGLDTMYAKISRDLYYAENKHLKHQVIEDMINKLKDKLPNQQSFEAKIDEKLFYSSDNTKQKKLIQYVLKRLEYERQNYNIELFNVSIEHIYPENPNNGWEAIDTKYIENIGNLVLLDRDINSKIGNKSYIEKRDIILKESTLITTKEVFQENSDWTETSIENRKKKIIEEIYGI